MQLWSGPAESVVSNTADDLFSLLNGFEPDTVGTYVALLPKDAMRRYLRMNFVRVVRLVEGARGGETWFDSFALALRRFGYEVMACDSYESYGEAFAAYSD